MNRQILIKEYADYSFTPEQISQELDIPLELVKSALFVYPKTTTEIKAKSLRYKSHIYDKRQATDRDRPMYELLYRNKPRRLNKMIKKMGTIVTAQILGCTRNDIVALKYHFGYYERIPGDALNKICYFSNTLRRKVDERDYRTCVRCKRPVNYDKIRYHKISHPGPMTVDNCATLCLNCRSTKILKEYDKDIHQFDGIGFEGFVGWIEEKVSYKKSKVQ